MKASSDIAQNHFSKENIKEAVNILKVENKSHTVSTKLICFDDF
jgi:hypothetical protein